MALASNRIIKHNSSQHVINGRNLKKYPSYPDKNDFKRKVKLSVAAAATKRKRHGGVIDWKEKRGGGNILVDLVFTLFHIDI
jgi:hypothetical protein